VDLTLVVNHLSQPSRVIAPRIVERGLLETVDTTPRPSAIAGLAYSVGKDSEKCV